MDLGACPPTKPTNINRQWLETQACLMSNDIKLSLKNYKNYVIFGKTYNFL